MKNNKESVEDGTNVELLKYASEYKQEMLNHMIKDMGKRYNTSLWIIYGTKKEGSVCNR